MTDESGHWLRVPSGGSCTPLTSWMKSWHKRIFNFTYRYLNDYDEASEVTQQTFIKAYCGRSGP